MPERAGAIGYRKFAFNDGVNSTETEIRSEDADLAYQTDAVALEVVSTSTNDDVAGTGARKIFVEGLDANWEIINETVIMDGTNPVDLTKLYLRVHRAYVTEVGSLGVNEGTITIRLDNAGVTQAEIPASKGQTLLANYTVPAWKDAVMRQLDFSVGSISNNSVVVMLRGYCRVYNETTGAYESWRQILSRVAENGPATLLFNNDELIFEPKTDFKLTAEKLTGTGDAVVNAAYAFRLS